MTGINKGLRYVRVRVLLLIIALIFLFGFFATSEAADYDFNNIEDIFGPVPATSCYNYTFIDSGTLRGTLLEQEEMDAARDNWNNISYNEGKNLCIPEKKLMAALQQSAATGDQSPEYGLSSANYSLSPNPAVGFVEDGTLDFEEFRSRETIFYGGLLPFVAIPDSDLATEDHFFNEESFSLFLYFKRKF
ncbi:MAG: hypothetical protein RIG61_12390 [Deltaproteobacteria bacterium]